MATQKCTKCGSVKELDQFHLNTSKSNGHTNVCKPCANTCSREWNAAHRGARNIAMRKWRDRNVEKYSERIHAKRLRQFYDMSADEYAAKLAAQNGCCAVCKQAETSRYKGTLRRLSVDHNHKTGEIRALLCTRCNAALGLVNDDPDILLAMINYLQQYTTSAGS